LHDLKKAENHWAHKNNQATTAQQTADDATDLKASRVHDSNVLFVTNPSFKADEHARTGIARTH
jgi:hypothetical protein